MNRYRMLLLTAYLVVATSFLAVAQEAYETAPPLDDSAPPVWDESLAADAAVDSGLEKSRVRLEASFQVAEGSREGVLTLRAAVEPGWHIYAPTQQPPLNPTDIRVTAGPELKSVGKFAADRDPQIHIDSVFPDTPIEEFSDEVTWTAPLSVAEGVDVPSLQIPITFRSQACSTEGLCEPVDEQTVTARFAGYLPGDSSTESFVGQHERITITGYASPQVVAPGDTLQLVLTAELQPTWHVYAWAAQDPQKVSKPTLIVLRKTSGWDYGDAQVSAEPKAEESGIVEEPVLYYHEGTVSWTIPIQVPEDAEPGEYVLNGGIGYQTCTPDSCDVPSAADFQFRVTVGAAASETRVPLTFSKGSYATIAQEAQALAQTRAERSLDTSAKATTWSDKSVMTVLALAFLAGLILNVMPCVLPVIGLKVMSFVQQSGGNRREILALNLWFSLGLMSVFWVLAAAAAYANHTWGKHFGDMRFLVTMIGIVFAFGLSFLGVWEIPIPGFVGSGKVQAAAAREGAVGAFSKGVLSTILATPCAGPLLVPAVSWATTQPAGLTFMTFTSIGLGMAFPYLLVGMAPGLIAFLPKPGAWMDTFKQTMGFLLMATVVFLFMSVPGDYTVPTLTLLLGIAIACWLIGRLPATAEWGATVRGWLFSLLVVAAAAVIGFVFLLPSSKIDWQPFSRITLEQHLEEGATVMVDFTADW